MMHYFFRGEEDKFLHGSIIIDSCRSMICTYYFRARLLGKKPPYIINLPQQCLCPFTRLINCHFNESKSLIPLSPNLCTNFQIDRDITCSLI
uniref:Uncharacterized protein n=1 Tax=Arundo donax TaxID=35708 RepID=A0A0A9DSU1_ARUDO